MGVWLAIAISVGLVAASVSPRHTPMLGLGVAGLFAFSVWAIGYYFGETIGTPLVLLNSEPFSPACPPALPSGS